MHLRPVEFRLCAACLSHCIPGCDTLVDTSGSKEPKRLAKWDVWSRVPAGNLAIPQKDLITGRQAGRDAVVEFVQLGLLAGDVPQVVRVEEIYQIREGVADGGHLPAI